MDAIEKQLQAEPRNRGYVLMMAFIVALLFAWSLTAVDLQHMTPGGLAIASNIITGILSPDWSFLLDFTKQGVLYLLLVTIAIAFLGTIIGAILAVPLAFLCASNVVGAKFAYVTRLGLIIIRTIPALIYGLMLIRVTGPGPFAGVLTIAISSIGMLTKLYTDSIENLDTSVLESMTSIGCDTFDKIRYGIIPQLSSIFMSIIIYRFDMNLRDASVLGLVGAGGIGAPLIFAMNAYRWSEVGSILIGLVILILLVEFFSNRIRARLVRG